MKSTAYASRPRNLDSKIPAPVQDDQAGASHDARLLPAYIVRVVCTPDTHSDLHAKPPHGQLASAAIYRIDGRPC